MKHLLSISCALLVAITALGQTTPPVKLRSNASFQQEDKMLIASERLGIPSGPTPTLTATTSAANTTKLFYDTDDQTLMVYDPISTTWSAVSVDLTNYYTKSQVDSAVTSQLQGYLPLVGNTALTPVTGDIWLDTTGAVRNATAINVHSRSNNPSVPPTGNWQVQGSIGGPTTTPTMSWTWKSATKAIRHEIGNQSQIGTDFVFFTRLTDGPADPESSSIKLRLFQGDNRVSGGDPNLNVARFEGSVLGRMPSSVGDGSGYYGNYATQGYVDENSALKTVGTSAILRSSRTNYGLGQYATDLASNGAATGNYSTVIGGVPSFPNTAAAPASAVIGGQGGSVASAASYGAIVGGALDTIASGGIQSVIVGGSNNYISHNGVGMIGGRSLRSGGHWQTVMGQYNVPTNDYLVIGAGTGNSSRANIFTVSVTGQVSAAGYIRGDAFRVDGLNTAPASPTSTGVLGEIRYTEDHIYVATGTNQWKRAKLDSEFKDGRMFSYTTSGDGTTLQFSVPHGLSYTPTMVIAQANSEDAITIDDVAGASISGGFRAYISGANVVIDYNNKTGYPTAPDAGTNNLTWTILVK